jgi:hypothetical protein
MPKFQYPNFCGQTYNCRSTAMASDRCINLYPEFIESGTGKNSTVLIGTPGIREVASTGKQEPIRGICTIGAKRILFAGWETLYEVNTSTKAVDVIGPIAPDVDWEGLGAVQFAFNGTEYCISSGGHGYILNGSTLTEVINMDSVTYLDGYFVALQAGEKKVRISGLYDGLTWNALDFKEKESARDYPNAIIADHGELWVLGEQTSEVWYNSGNSDFPFERVPSGRLELGSTSRYAPAKLDNSLFWIGNDERGNRVVWRADGYQAKRISTHAIEYRLNLIAPNPSGYALTAASTTFAIGWAYQEEGHSFYCIIFPAPPHAVLNTADKYTNATMLCYDCATGMWHERAWWNKAMGRFEPPRQRCHAYVWDHHIVGDRENGKLYTQHLDWYDDNGDRIRRERIGMHLSNQMKQTYYRSFQLDMEVAVGLGVIDSSLYGPDKDGITYEP